MKYLIGIFIIVPALEIGAFLLASRTAGVLPSVLLIILTGTIGAYLAKKQGIETIRKIQRELASGRIPGDSLIDGACILIGGCLLISPGFLTDILGLFLMLPPHRRMIKPLVKRSLRKAVEKKRVTIIR
ncbi:FxsA family protein [Peribacillus sp. SCS-37]|uniref:FxsA family protein n=1 Tax=Paraperibacillus esterisolvens TaxID=3115296 RepID=UPI003905C607